MRGFVELQQSASWRQQAAAEGMTGTNAGNTCGSASPGASVPQCITGVRATVRQWCQCHCASPVSVPLCVTGVSATVRHRCQCHCASLVSVPLCVTGVSATVRHRCQCHSASPVSVPPCVTGVSATVHHRCHCHCCVTGVSATGFWTAEEALTGACTTCQCQGTACHCTLVQRCSVHLMSASFMAVPRWWTCTASLWTAKEALTGAVHSYTILGFKKQQVLLCQ